MKNSISTKWVNNLSKFIKEINRKHHSKDITVQFKKIKIEIYKFQIQNFNYKDLKTNGYKWFKTLKNYKSKNSKM